MGDREREACEMLETADRTDCLASSEHVRTILSMHALFYVCIQPLKAVEKDCSKVSH